MCADCRNLRIHVCLKRLVAFPAVAGLVSARSLREPTAPQKRGWPPIARGESTLHPRADRQRQDADGVPVVAQPADVRAAARARPARCRVLYISPLKALAVDVERNLRAPLAGISNMAAREGHRRFTRRSIAVRTGDTPASERAKFQRAPADILITTPESLFLLLTSNAHETSASRSRR